MVKINEATDTDLKVIEELTKIGWRRGDTLLYQQEYILTPEQQKIFEGRKSIRPDITLTDLNGNILTVFENKFEDEKKALTRLRTLYANILKPRFLYACSPERILFYDTEWKGLEAGEATIRAVNINDCKTISFFIGHPLSIFKDKKTVYDGQFQNKLILIMSIYNKPY